jgi:CheY-like chemotaxis protein
MVRGIDRMGTNGELVAQADQVEAMLHVGMACVCASAETEHRGPHHKAYVRGWQKDSFILIELLPTEDQEAMLQDGAACFIKFRLEGDTWRFGTSVVDWWQSQQSHYFRLTWPEEVGKVAARRHERIDAQMPCNVVFEEGTWVKGQIRDLGAGGCRLCVKTPPETGSAVQLSFSLPDGTTLEDVRSLVRTASPFGKGAFLGCEFVDEEEDARREVELFVATHLERNRVGFQPGKRVLILERDNRLASGLRGALERKGFDVLSAGGMVDGFSLLRTMLPSVLLVNYNSEQMDGLSICKVIRSTPGFRKLPLFLYGPESAEMEQAALAAGASGYIPYLLSAGKIVDSMFSGVDAAALVQFAAGPDGAASEGG